jgi:hypothetical protein
MSKVKLFIRAALAELVFLIVFMTIWITVGKFAENILQVQPFSWVMFWGAMVAIIGLPLARLCKHLFLNVVWEVK